MKNKKKLLALALSYYLSPGEISGGETRCLGILKNLRRYRISLVSSVAGIKTFSDRGVTARKYRFFYHSERFGMTGNYLLRTAFGIFHCPPDCLVVYCYTDFLPDVVTAFLYKLLHRGSSWVQTINHVITNPQKRRGRKLTAYLSFYSQKISHFLVKRSANKIIAISPLVRDDLLRLKFPSQKLTLSSAGVDFDYFQRIEPSLRKYEGVYMGRLNPTKGVFDLVDIWKRVTKVLPTAKLAIIGGAENKNILRELRQRIKKCGLTNKVSLFGFLPEKSAFAIVKSAQTFLFPSHEEGWGISIAESMSCGTPVFAWDLPVYKEIFGDKIQKVKEGDFGIFAEKVISVIKNKNLRKKLSTEGKSFIRRYSWKKVAANEESIFEQALVSDK